MMSGSDPSRSSQDEDRQQALREQIEVRAAMALVESGQANGVAISGFQFTSLDQDLRAEAEARGLRLDLEMLSTGGWSARIHRLDADHPLQVLSSGPGPTSSGSAVEILLIEDDPTLAMYVARFLSAHGHLVRVVETEEAAEVALLHEQRPALVLLDINLPGRSGWSLFDSAAYLAAGAPPVLIASATAIRTSRLAEHPIAGYLPKPFSMETLLAVVERSLHPSNKVEPPLWG